MGVMVNVSHVRSYLLGFSVFCVVGTLVGRSAERDALVDYEIGYWKVATGYPSPTVRGLCQTPDGQMWALTDFALVKLARDHFEHIGGDRFRIGSQREGLICVDHSGLIWIATSNGLYCWDGERYRRFDESGGLSSSDVLTVQLDEVGGGVWVATVAGVDYVSSKGAVTSVWRGMAFNFIRAHPKVGLLGGARFELHCGKFGGSSKRIPTVSETIFSSYYWGPILGVEIEASGMSILAGGSLVRCDWNGDQKHVVALDVEESPYLPFLFQDSQGQLWSHGGQAELLRVRGDRVDTIRLPLEDPKDWPVCMFEDREGGLWVGLQYSGLVRLEPHRIASLTTDQGLVQRSAWVSYAASDGSIWVGTNGGISQIRYGRSTDSSDSEHDAGRDMDNRWDRLNPFVVQSFPGVDGVFDGYVRTICEGDDGVLWVGTGRGCVRIVEGLLEGAVNGILKEFEDVRASCPSHNGGFWLAARSGVFHVLSAGGVTEVSPPVLEGVTVTVLCEMRDGTLWIGTENEGVFRIEDLRRSVPDGPFSVVQPSRGEPRVTAIVEPGAIGTVWAIYEDAEGGLWFGGDGGLMVNRNSIWEKFGVAQGLLEETTHWIAGDEAGGLWFSGSEGIYYLAKSAFGSHQDGSVRQLRPVVFGTADGLPSPRPAGKKGSPAGCRSADGLLWFPTDKGVAVIDPSRAVEGIEPPRVRIDSVRSNEELVFQYAGRTARESLTDDVPLRVIIEPGGGNLLEIVLEGNSYQSQPLSYQYRLLGLDPTWRSIAGARTVYYTRLPPGEYRFEVVGRNANNVLSPIPGRMEFLISKHYSETVWFRLGVILLVGVCGGLLVRARFLRTRRMHALYNQLRVAEERTRIAQDLHDEMGPKLTELGRLLEFEQLAGDPPKDSKANVCRIAQELAESVDSTVWTIRPDSDSVESLASYLGDFAHRLLYGRAMQLHLDYPDVFPEVSLSGEVRHQLFGIASESIHNAIKHSHASNLWLRLWVEGDHIVLQVEDDGNGVVSMNPTERGQEVVPDGALDGDAASLSGRIEAESLRPGIGLQSIRRRAEKIGAVLDLRSRSRGGTRMHLILRVPSDPEGNES